MSLVPRLARVVLVLALLPLGAAGGQQPAPAHPLFASDDVISLTVELPLRLLRGDRGQDRERSESALEVLRRRYAAGELTDEEFDAKRRRLEGP